MFAASPARKRLAAAVLMSVVGFAVVGCAHDEVSMPPDDATPEQVVRAYADAVHAGDCETADALVAGWTKSWCGTIDITSLTLTGRTQERKETEAGGGPTIERVWTRLTSSGGDVSLPDGEFDWSFLLDRTGPNAAWRIYDQGMG